MAVRGEDGTKKKIETVKCIYIRKATMKYGRLVVFIRHDSAEIWGFGYGLTLVIGTLKLMAGTSVFVRIVFALKHSTKNFTLTQSIILT
jgi:hypothetical protein